MRRHFQAGALVIALLFSLSLPIAAQTLFPVPASSAAVLRPDDVDPEVEFVVSLALEALLLRLLLQ